MRPLRIAITGTHNSGKTTICHDVTYRLMRNGLKVGLTVEPSRTSLYLASNVRNFSSQMDIFARTVAYEMEAGRTNDIVLCDRSIIDALAYNETLPLSNAPTDIMFKQAMTDFAKVYLQTYDAIFKTGWQFDMAKSADTLRIGDSLQQTQVDKHISDLLSLYYPHYETLSDPHLAADLVSSKITQLLEHT